MFIQVSTARSDRTRIIIQPWLSAMVLWRHCTQHETECAVICISVCVASIVFFRILIGAAVSQQTSRIELEMYYLSNYFVTLKFLLCHLKIMRFRVLLYNSIF